eukprot:3786868-Pleurochrysis_carterae.AAC.1
MAHELAWHDVDVIAQAGEGGVEPRAQCELLTVLTFHHPGLLEHATAAAAAVEADLREGWVAPPVRHLPFVPCRLQPRDVILQVRQRVVQETNGATRVEDYQKPRVTTNSSFGGQDGVNAAVPEEERVVALPR